MLIKSERGLCVERAVRSSINKIKEIDVMESIYEMLDIPEDLQEFYFDTPTPSFKEIIEVKQETSRHEKILKIIKKCKHKNPVTRNLRGLLIDTCEKCRKKVNKLEIV